MTFHEFSVARSLGLDPKKWATCIIDSGIFLFVLGPVFSLAEYLPAHNFSAQGWTWPLLGDRWIGRFDPIGVGARFGLVVFFAGILRAERRELFDG